MWLRTDETNEAIKSLYKTHQFVLEIHEDAYNWKWVIIALHNSTQAFMVLALKGTASFNVCKNWKKFLDAMLSGDDYPELRMEIFQNLYRYIKSEDSMKIGVSSKNFLASMETDYAMKKLNEIRNNFIHFVLSHWSLEISMLPGLCKAVLCVIEFLILESGNIRFYTNYELEKASLSKLISDIRKELETLEKDYITSITDSFS
jgi:hypothetical protein